MTGRPGWVVGWLCLPLLVAASPPRNDDAAQLRALRLVDARLAGVGYRLATANAALCRDLQPGTGATLHALDQYDPALRPAARQVFGFATPVAVELVVPGSPADRAGILADDGVVAIDGAPLSTGDDGAATDATRDAAAARIVAAPPTAPLLLSLTRSGTARTATVMPVAECRVGFELLLGPKLVADSDGRQVQIGAAYFARYDDDQVAVIVAHELAHVILRHRVRLEAAGVHWGVLGQLGRSARLFRQTEDAADQLSVSLLRNAGYDPAIAVRFWLHDIGTLDGGVLHGATHGSSSARAKAIAAEIASIPATALTPYVPPVLATRDQPLE
ncbi:PDZ domain-containing protein [uncultured Sphingomonas sp.]|uniref:M48 family metallopeptidase n=1 Tax=uncultured Sphingomonas sp. TaxID=158754 RepID=UPI0035CB131D